MAITNSFRSLVALLAAIILSGVAVADSTIRISDGNQLSMTLSEKSCALIDKKADDKRWVEVSVVDRDTLGNETGNAFTFRLGEEYGRRVEQLQISSTGEEPYGPVSLFDRLEQELMANMEKWSAEQIADQDDLIAEADGQPIAELDEILISVGATPSAEYFSAVREAERFPAARVDLISVEASDLTVANGDAFQTADIDLQGPCRIVLMSE